MSCLMDLSLNMTKMTECKHSWHEFYASQFDLMRECYSCCQVDRLVRGEWVEDD